jgi:hypothetical protein
MIPPIKFDAGIQDPGVCDELFDASTVTLRVFYRARKMCTEVMANVQEMIRDIGAAFQEFTSFSLQEIGHILQNDLPNGRGETFDQSFEVDDDIGVG